MYIQFIRGAESKSEENKPYVITRLWGSYIIGGAESKCPNYLLQPMSRYIIIKEHARKIIHPGSSYNNTRKIDSRNKEIKSGEA